MRRHSAGGRTLALAVLLLGAVARVPAQTVPAIVAARSETLAPEVHARRRARLLERLPDGSVAVVCAAAVHPRNGDVDHPYRPSSDFWYLTGFGEPGAVLVVRAAGDAPESTLFVPPRDPDAERWTGPRLGVQGAAPLADAVAPLDELERALPGLLAGAKEVHLDDGGDRERRALVERSLPRGIEAESRPLRHALGRLRLVKEPEELALLQRAVDITCAAQAHAMRHCEPGLHEFELEAVIEATHALLGARREGYESIVGSGANSCILHYNTNRARIEPGTTIVVDVGAEFGMYTADVTRTLPADGRFTVEQRAIYQAVLAAQEAAIAEVKPGATIRGVEQAARRALGAALLDAGVVRSRDAALALLPHGVSHWLGLDVHDSCPYHAEDGRGEVRFEPGMVLTVEPGCYVPAGTPGVDARWHGIGVRIEDDVVVTAAGCIVMSGALPRTIEGIERLMAEESAFPRLLEAEAQR